MLNESSAESTSFLHYFHAAISNHLSEKPKMSRCLWSLNTGLTVFDDNKGIILVVIQTSCCHSLEVHFTDTLLVKTHNIVLWRIQKLPILSNLFFVCLNHS